MDYLSAFELTGQPKTLNEVSSLANYINDPIDFSVLSIVNEVFEKLIVINLSVDKIVNIVSNYFNVNLNQENDGCRKRVYVIARQVSMYFAKQLTKHSLASIGKKIGNKDHATVLYAVKTINNIIATDRKFKAQIKEIEFKLKIL